VANIRPVRSMLALGVAAVTVAVWGMGSASSSVYLDFRLPSGNIGCGYSTLPGEAPNLRCEILSLLRPMPPRPKSCGVGVGGGVWGQAVAMAPTGRASGRCISDTVMNPSAPVLGYGERWAHGGFTCISRTTGLTCTNRDGHGWFLSRASSRIF